jgi:hypothetical protein
MDTVVLALIVIVVLLVIVVVFVVIFSPGSVTVYYRYPSPQSVQEGTFGVDPIVTSSRYTQTYSDSAATKVNGSLQTVNTYTSYPGDQMFTNKMLYLKTGSSSFSINSTHLYTANPPSPPALFDFSNAYVMSSTNTTYIGKKVTIAHVNGDIYRLTF